MLTRYVVGLSCLLAATNTGLAAISVDASVSVDQASANAKIVSPAFSTTAGNELCWPSFRRIGCQARTPPLQASEAEV